MNKAQLKFWYVSVVIVLAVAVPIVLAAAYVFVRFFIDSVGLIDDDQGSARVAFLIIVAITITLEIISTLLIKRLVSEYKRDRILNHIGVGILIPYFVYILFAMIVSWEVVPRFNDLFESALFFEDDYSGIFINNAFLGAFLVYSVTGPLYPFGTAKLTGK